LDALFNRLKEKGVRVCAWYEEDMGNQLTAIATAPLRGNERKPMKRLKLLGQDTQPVAPSSAKNRRVVY
jgi:hypothetical protein